MSDVNRRAYLTACYRFTLAILCRRRARRVRIGFDNTHEKREELGLHQSLIQELRLHDGGFFFNFFFSKVIIFGMDLDRLDRSYCPRVVSRSFTKAPIVRIELSYLSDRSRPDRPDHYDGVFL